MNKTESMFSLEFLVRDYECDLQGIVNNACYQHYFEHTRHQFIKETGLDFAGMHKDGINPVVVRAEIDFKFPLTSGDIFFVYLSVKRKGRLRLVFLQDIYRKQDEKLICQGLFEVAILKMGKPINPDSVMKLIQEKFHE